MSDLEETFILHLFESYWSELPLFTSKPPKIALQQPQLQESNGDDKPKLNRITTTMRRSYSVDQLLSSTSDACPSDTSSPSPTSVLGPHLQTILSGKEVRPEPTITEDLKLNTKKIKKGRERRRSTGSRSLSELEFEEVKGFMDLGFVFSDEEKDSRLVSIIPGLRRKVQVQEHELSVSRPYLSEAWDCLDLEDEIKNQMVHWRIPAFGSEMELKNHIRCWAHNVAATVR